MSSKENYFESVEFFKANNVSEKHCCLKLIICFVGV